MVKRIFFAVIVICGLACAQTNLPLMGVGFRHSSGGTITVRNFTTDQDSGLSTRSLQTSGAQAGDAILCIPVVNGGISITAASWSSGVATLTLSSTGPSVGDRIGVGSVQPIGYDGVFTVTGVSGSNITYALATNPGGIGTVFGGVESPISSVTDDSGNTYTEVSGSYNTISSLWVATNISLHSGGTQPTVTASVPTWSGPIGFGLLPVGGLDTNRSTVVDVVATNAFDNTNVSTIVTPTIAGNFSPELFIAFAGTFNSGTDTAVACGHQFTNLDSGNHDGIAGYPAGYFINSSASSTCAGLVESPAGNAWSTIVSLKTP